MFRCFQDFRGRALRCEYAKRRRPDDPKDFYASRGSRDDRRDDRRDRSVSPTSHSPTLHRSHRAQECSVLDCGEILTESTFCFHVCRRRSRSRDRRRSPSPRRRRSRSRSRSNDRYVSQSITKITMHAR